MNSWSQEPSPQLWTQKKVPAEDFWCALCPCGAACSSLRLSQLLLWLWQCWCLGFLGRVPEGPGIAEAPGGSELLLGQDRGDGSVPAPGPPSSQGVQVLPTDPAGAGRAFPGPPACEQTINFSVERRILNLDPR